MKKLNIIFANPREDSLTAKIALIAKDIANNANTPVLMKDLYRDNFDPVLYEADEPDWNNSQKIYSDDVMKRATELSSEDLMVIVFPVWWYSVPAVLKGYIDRVWNHGITYGEGSKPPASKIIWIALVGETENGFKKRNNDSHMEKQLCSNIAGFNGVKESEVIFVYNTIGEDIDDLDNHYDEILNRIRDDLDIKISDFFK